MGNGQISSLIYSNNDVRKHRNSTSNDNDDSGINFSKEVDPQYIPVRLTYEERQSLRLTESALYVSEYTNVVDVISYSSKANRIQTQLRHISQILLGLSVCNDYKKGRQLVQNREIYQNEKKLQEYFELARRYKMMNPEKLRSEFGKLVYLCQDNQIPEIYENLGFTVCKKQIRTVYEVLVNEPAYEEVRKIKETLLAEDEKNGGSTSGSSTSNSGENGKLMNSDTIEGAKEKSHQKILEETWKSSVEANQKWLLEFLQDPRIFKATQVIDDDKNKSRYEIQREIKRKEEALESLLNSYCRNSFHEDQNNSNRKGGRKTAPVTEDTLKLCLYSIGDANSLLYGTQKPIQKMLRYLQKYFKFKKKDLLRQTTTSTVNGNKNRNNNMKKIKKLASSVVDSDEDSQMEDTEKPKNAEEGDNNKEVIEQQQQQQQQQQEMQQNQQQQQQQQEKQQNQQQQQEEEEEEEEEVTEEEQNFDDELSSLAIQSGRDGARLSHDHQRQLLYVYQSLTLWEEIMENLTKLWMLAEQDLFSGASNPYSLQDTGQGLNRVQQAPRVGREMLRILHKVQKKHAQDLGLHWVGSSVIHLGDHNVPNALMFIDKYTQVPRIINPIVLTLEYLDHSLMDKEKKVIIDTFGSVERCKRYILRDFFRHGFDGSGADNFIDAGSCIDGRLTSAWNWASTLHKKDYYFVFKLSGFSSFDGDFSNQK